MKISKDDSIGDVIKEHPDTIMIFLRAGLHCIGCCAANFETIGQGCSAHGIDADELVEELNDSISKEEK